MSVYVGKPPQGEDWLEHLLPRELYGTEWAISIQRPKTKAKKWLEVKLWARAPVETKANYVTAYHLETGVLADTKDLRMMKKYRPDLMPALLTKLQSLGADYWT